MMTTTIGRRHLLLTTAMTLLLGACSATSTPAATSTPNGAATAPSQQTSTSAANPTTAAAGGSDPCSLLVQAEVDTAVGQPLGVGKQVATLDDCQWSTSDFIADVDVTVSDWSDIKAAATSGTTAPTSISGVGDEALNLNGSNGSLLYVRKGDVGFLVTINGPHIDSLPDHGLAQEKVLAAAILGRL